MHPPSHFRTQLIDLRATVKLRVLVADQNLQVHSSTRASMTRSGGWASSTSPTSRTRSLPEL